MGFQIKIGLKEPYLKWGDLRLDSLDYYTRLNRDYYDQITLE